MTARRILVTSDLNEKLNSICGLSSTYMEFTLAFDPKPEFSFSFKYL